MKKIFCFIILMSFTLLHNSHSQYVEQVSGVTSALTSASATLTGYGYNAWVCGYNGVVLRTTNAGNNWTNVSGNGIPNTISLISITNIDQYIAVTAGYSGSNTFAYKTTNGGANWLQVFTETNGFIDAVYLSTNYSGTGFIYGDPVGGRWSLWKTTNNGLNWDSTGLYLPQSGSEAGWNNAMCVRNNHIWFGTNNTRVYHSRNFGLNWTAGSNIPELNSYAVWFAMDTLYGYVGGSMLIRTSNSGTTWWRDTTAPGTGNFSGFTEGTPGVKSYPPFIVWYTRSNNSIYWQMGSGPWTNAYTAPAGTYRHISPYLCGFAYAVRSNGGITRVQTQFGGIRKISSSFPAGFKLYDNYPNPFNPTTTIKFDVPENVKLETSNLKMVIYDMLGREIEVLVNEILKSGTYEVEWSAEKYTSGIYFYRLTTDGYSVTKKMILIK